MTFSVDAIGAVAHPTRLMARFRRVSTSPVRHMRPPVEDDARQAPSADWQGFAMSAAGSQSLEHLARIAFG